MMDEQEAVEEYSYYSRFVLCPVDPDLLDKWMDENCKPRSLTQIRLMSSPSHQGRIAITVEFTDLVDAMMFKMAMDEDFMYFYNEETLKYGDFHEEHLFGSPCKLYGDQPPTLIYKAHKGSFKFQEGVNLPNYGSGHYDDPDAIEEIFDNDYIIVLRVPSESIDEIFEVIGDHKIQYNSEEMLSMKGFIHDLVVAGDQSLRDNLLVHKDYIHMVHKIKK